MKNTDVYRQNPDCLLEEMDGELLLYNPTSAVTLHLNEPSTIVWRLCDGERTIDKIIALVQTAYPDQAKQIVEDVASVIDDLRDRQVLQLIQ